MTLATVSDVAFLLGRLLFGGVLAFMGLNHFQQTDWLAGYAESKGVPLPKVSVLGSGAVLILGGVAIVLGVLPVVAGAALGAFLLSSAVLFHDFWNVEDPEEKQSEMTDFLKNVALTGGALSLLAVGGAAWPLALSL
ncbi:MAG: DoxX family protein [Halobacteriaceae archaeon]